MTWALRSETTLRAVSVGSPLASQDVRIDLVLIKSNFARITLPQYPPCEAIFSRRYEVGPRCTRHASESPRRCSAPVRAVRVERQQAQLEPPSSRRLDLRTALEAEVRQEVHNEAGVCTTKRYVERCDIARRPHAKQRTCPHAKQRRTKTEPPSAPAGAEARELVARTQVGPAFTVQRVVVPTLAAADE
eukprot:scaffold41536_cov63-Phaeocystis_antarctica.AAC.5